MALDLEARMAKEIVYVDMDGVVVDFPYDVNDVDPSIRQECIKAWEQEERHHSDVEGLFATLKPVQGAAEAIHKLMEKYHVYLLSTSPWKNTHAWSDKRRWVEKYLPNFPKKHLILTHRKDLNRGKYLIDDRPNNGAKEFGEYDGQEWIHFPSDDFKTWDEVLYYLK